MKRTYILTSDETKYILKYNSPYSTKEPFCILHSDLKFDTAKFYSYVFEEIETKTEMEVINQVDENDKVAKEVYRAIKEIIDGVIEKMNISIFPE